MRLRVTARDREYLLANIVVQALAVVLSFLVVSVLAEICCRTLTVAHSVRRCAARTVSRFAAHNNWCIGVAPSHERKTTAACVGGDGDSIGWGSGGRVWFQSRVRASLSSPQAELFAQVAALRYWLLGLLLL